MYFQTASTSNLVKCTIIALFVFASHFISPSSGLPCHREATWNFDAFFSQARPHGAKHSFRIFWIAGPLGKIRAPTSLFEMYLGTHSARQLQKSTIVPLPVFMSDFFFWFWPCFSQGDDLRPYCIVLLCWYRISWNLRFQKKESASHPIPLPQGVPQV